MYAYIVAFLTVHARERHEKVDDKNRREDLKEERRRK